VLPASLGVSSRRSLEVNSICVARSPGESIGGLMTLRHKDGRVQARSSRSFPSLRSRR